MEVFRTIRNIPIGHYNGYSYRLRGESAEGVETWTCTHYSDTKCSGRIRYRQYQVISISAHQCGPPCGAKLEVSKQILKARVRAQTESTPISQIIAEELENRGEAFTSRRPARSSILKALQRARNFALGILQEPPSFDDTPLNDSLKTLDDGSTFLLCDDCHFGRLLIFSSMIARECLKKTTTFLMTESWECRNEIPHIFTIYAQCGDLTGSLNVNPVAFILLPNKNRETYVRMLRLIADNIPQWRPQSVIVDSEIALISALREVFEHVTIIGNFVFLKKSFWNIIEEVDMSIEYYNSREIQKTIRMCAALPFLRPEDITDGYNMIQCQAPFDNKLDAFFRKFLTQWIDNSNLPCNVWRCHINQFGIQNDILTWYDKGLHYLKYSDSKLRHIIARFKKEATVSNIKINFWVRLGPHADHSQIAEKLSQNYEENGDFFAFLSALSTLIQLK